MTTVLEAKGLTAGYAGVPVVRDLDLTVEAGEVVALLGPNGAGKTTTLLTLAGVVPPISGSAQVLGEEVAGGRPHKVARRGAVLVPDDRAIFFELTARENLRLGAGGKSRQRRRRHRARLLPVAEAAHGRPARACCPAASSRCWPSAGRSAAGRRS